jgi:ubiquinone/menaquinone biosynthesis C-methylase UbiE
VLHEENLPPQHPGSQMSRIQALSDPHYVASQYQNADNLNTRIRFHQRFSTNPYGWQRWIFDQLDLPSRCRILELGCGPGDLWFENSDRIPAGWEVVLSDLSPGMLRQAQDRLGGNGHFRYGALDAQSIPFENGSFEAVIANHMLFHVPDWDKALAEIQRVLKPDGRFYASTSGERHQQEMRLLLGRFDPRLASWGGRSSNSFTLENGPAQLSQWFGRVTLRRYEDSFVIPEAMPLVDFILSGTLKLSPDRKDDFIEFVKGELQQCGGILYITKDSGVFEASHDNDS